MGDGVDGLEIFERDFILFEDNLKENDKLHFHLFFKRLDAIHFISCILLNYEHDLADFVF